MLSARNRQQVQIYRPKYGGQEVINFGELMGTEHTVENHGQVDSIANCLEHIQDATVENQPLQDSAYLKDKPGNSNTHEKNRRSEEIPDLGEALAEEGEIQGTSFEKSHLETSSCAPTSLPTFFDSLLVDCSQLRQTKPINLDLILDEPPNQRNQTLTIESALAGVNYVPNQGFLTHTKPTPNLIEPHHMEDLPHQDRTLYLTNTSQTPSSCSQPNQAQNLLLVNSTPLKSPQLTNPNTPATVLDTNKPQLSGDTSSLVKALERKDFSNKGDLSMGKDRENFLKDGQDLDQESVDDEEAPPSFDARVDEISDENSIETVVHVAEESS